MLQVWLFLLHLHYLFIIISHWCHSVWHVDRQPQLTILFLSICMRAQSLLNDVSHGCAACGNFFRTSGVVSKPVNLDLGVCWRISDLQAWLKCFMSIIIFSLLQAEVRVQGSRCPSEVLPLNSMLIIGIMKMNKRKWVENPAARSSLQYYNFHYYLYSAFCGWLWT